MIVILDKVATNTAKYTNLNPNQTHLLDCMHIVCIFKVWSLNGTKKNEKVI